jgi:hypothetical protein
MDLSQAGKLILIAGVALVFIGGIIMLAGRLPFIGQLPGDFEFRRGNTTVYFPLATMIIVSIILTILLNLWLRR